MGAEETISRCVAQPVLLDCAALKQRMHCSKNRAGCLKILERYNSIRRGGLARLDMGRRPAP
jgi:hypothetical protein